MDRNYLNQVNEIYEIMHLQSMKLGRLQIEHVFFTWRWWLLFTLSIVPWFIWIKIRKKESTHRLLYAGITLSIAAVFFDFVGLGFGLWLYPVTLIPGAPSIIPWDVCLLPIFTMLFLQFKPLVSPFVKGIVFSSLGSFFWQPFGEWVGVYIPKHWPHYYSFPIFLAMYLLANYLYTRNSFEK